jgi:hypothetical protein
MSTPVAHFTDVSAQREALSEAASSLSGKAFITGFKEFHPPGEKIKDDWDNYKWSLSTDEKSGEVTLTGTPKPLPPVKHKLGVVNFKK